MTAYANAVRRRNVPQTEQVDPAQVHNNQGGFSFQVDCWTRLDRFLILGAEGGSFYAGERKLILDNAQAVKECAAIDPKRTVDRIVEISLSGRAIKNDPAIFCLALMAGMQPTASVGRRLKVQRGRENLDASRLALGALNQVCRTGTHLFQFIDIVTELRGWGRGLRRAVANWYTSKDADKLAYQVTKYQQRGGWSHRDLLRLSHPNPRNVAQMDVFQYVTQREKWLASKRAGHALLVTVEEARTASITKVKKWIREEGLAWEHLPTHLLNEIDIWHTLVEANMGATAMVRNLGKMTSIGLLTPLSSATNLVCKKLRDPEFLKAGRVHPFSILLALDTYRKGRGDKGSLTWNPTKQIESALDEAFYASFGAVEPTNKKFLFGIDVSGSMGWSYINNTRISCAQAAACLAMVTLRTEPESYAHGFSGNFIDLGIGPEMRLKEAMQCVQHSDFGSTDCSLPMQYALQRRLEVDCFCVLTDSETETGRVHPHIALEQYRQKMGRNAKLIVVGLSSGPFTIANPLDAGMLDMVGFDAAGPAAIAEFVR